MIGIYCIKNRINNKRYIGKSLSIECRTYGIQNKIIGYYRNDHLTNSIEKYGIQNFTVEILEECTSETLNEKEIYWINHYKSYDPDLGYNKTLGGDGGKLTEETKSKMSESHRGISLSPQHAASISKSLKGKPHSLEHNVRVSSSLKGRVLSDTWKSKISSSNKGNKNHLGHKHSSESKEKMSESRKGKPRGPYKEREYHLICKSCNEMFIGRSPTQRYCINCNK